MTMALALVFTGDFLKTLSFLGCSQQYLDARLALRVYNRRPFPDSLYTERGERV